MQAILTSNKMDIISIKKYNDNFILSLLIPIDLAPFNNTKICSIFKIYYQYGMELNQDNEYTDDLTHKYEFIPTRSITDALNQIYDFLNIKFSEDEENSLVISCDTTFTTQAVHYMENLLSEHSARAPAKFDCLDLYQYLHIVNIDNLVKMLKFSLHTEFIYPDDPISFGFALSKIMNQVT